MIGSGVPGTVPYPWPYDSALTAGGTALVVAGAQRWWAERTDSVPEVLGRIERLRVAARAAGVAVFLVSHCGPSRGGPPYLPDPGGPGAEWALAPAADERVVGAAGLSGCFGGPLLVGLRATGIARVLLAGLGLEGPVHSTLRALNDRGYECLLIADACAAGDPGTRAGAVSSVTMSGGIFGAVGTTTAVLTALATLAAPAQSPAFPQTAILEATP